MLHRFCRSCKASLHAADGHGECVSCLGKSHAEGAFNETECPHCEDMSLASLRSRIAFFSERDSAPRALPFPSSQEPVKKKQRGRGSKRCELSELTSPQPPRASPSPQREDSPVLFARPDLVSFGGSEDAGQHVTGCFRRGGAVGSVNDPAPLPSADTSGPRIGTGMDTELFHVLTRAVDELGLEWSPPEEPSHSLLDEWFLLGRRQAPHQRASPFFPEVQEELTRSWRAPYSACQRTSSSSAPTSVDGAEDKGYEKLPPLDELVVAHLCPPTAIAGQPASALHSMAVLQLFQAKLWSESGFYSRYFLVPKKDGSLLLSHLECLGLKVNLAKSALHPSRRILFLGAVFDSTQMRAIVVPDQALAMQRLVVSFKIGASHPLKTFQKMLGLMASASPVLNLGLLRMQPLQYWLKPRVPSHAWRHGRLRIRVDQACVDALIPWKNSQWMERGVPLGMVCRRKVVTTDASNTGWGALCDGKPAFGLWMEAEAGIHINCLEMLAVCRALHFFLPDLKGHHVLVHSDSMTVVSYINHQGGLSSKRLFTLVKDLLEWAQLNLCSLRATHVPGKLNQGADMLPRSSVPSGEWTLHPQVVQKIWEVFGKAEVDLFASEDNSHCPITQASQGTETQTPSGGPSLEKPALVLRAVPAARSSPLAHSPETRPPLSGKRDNMTPPAQAVGPAPLVSGRESMNLSESVLIKLELRLQDASMLLSGLSFPPGAQPAIVIGNRGYDNYDDILGSDGDSSLRLGLECDLSRTHSDFRLDSRLILERLQTRLGLELRDL
ncbi:ORF V: Enzymatic polyprotein [Labeo rohita]|uniref:ORF V: Enzymatic polyprotein n=1 Tax=Labeo rohita TaxID=84645 RepID=A0ABQ8L619_LABRO|nr:ORF V: Enzymatic polyprotein [Labeo rohita]